MRPWYRLVCTTLAFVLACGGFSLPAGAQSSDETGIISIAVVDAATKKPLENARVFLLGPSVASALTNRSGIVKYTDVASGLYRVRTNKAGFQASTSAQFEVLGNKQVDVNVAMGQSTQAGQPPPTVTSVDESGLKVIGRVQARVTVTTRDVDENSAIRRISDSLADALNTVGGVDITQVSNDPDSPQTISLHGHDESQTAVTLDGIPLGAPGSSTNLRAIGTDLFTGANVSFGARAGALGGGVNFSTLQPTQSWQERLTSAYGSFDKYNWSFGETGSIGKLGVAIMTTKRGGNNPLTFQDYLDSSGVAYPHGGESTAAGDLIKLRYGLTENTTLIFTALENNTATASLCTQFTGPLPCGSGPGNTSTGKYQFMYGTIQSLVGQTALQLTGYTSSQYSLSNQIDRTIDTCIGAAVPCPVANPFASQTNSIARGIATQVTITKDNHTLTLNASTFASQTTFLPLVVSAASAPFVLNSVNAISSATYQLADSIKINNRLSFGPTASFATTTGAGSSILAGLSGAWRPNDQDSINFSAAVGSSQPASNLVRSFSDPDSARVNCFAGTAQVSGPGDQPTKQSAIDYSLSWAHQWSRGQISADVYRQTQAGQLVNASVTAAAAGLSASYFDAIEQYYATVCPVFGAANIYVNEPVNDTTRMYAGFDISGRLALGRDVTVIPSYSSNASLYTAADPQFTGAGSTLILGQQIFGRPLHKGNLTIDAYHPPSKLEFLVNAQYVGINNAQHLTPYVNFSAGITHPVGIGMLTIFENNLFNTQTGLFSTLAYAVPQPINGGGFLLTAANPQPPRTIQVSYAFNTGARPGAGFARVPGGRGAGRQLASSGASPAPNRSPRPGGVFGFGQLKFVAPPAGVNQLTLAASRPECTAELQPRAQVALKQLALAASAYVAGTALPAVDGVEITPHGDPHGAWYFGLGPNIPPALLRRPGQQAGGGQAQRRAPGGPGEAGGPPVGFQPQVNVAPPTPSGSPRPQFTPGPELLAALQPFRALVSCSYGTVMTPDEAKASGFDVPTPGVRPSPRPSPSPGAGGAPNPTGPRGGGFIDYAPVPGIFVVRPPDLGVGGGAVSPR